MGTLRIDDAVAAAGGPMARGRIGDHRPVEICFGAVKLYSGPPARKA